MITPILHKPHTDAEAQSTEDNAEARMRQALGKLGTAKPGKPEASHRANPYQAKHGAGRHRFRQDGEVPVVRISLAEGGRGTERHAHAPVERGSGHESAPSVRFVRTDPEPMRPARTAVRAAA